MANNCEYELRITGTRKDCEAFKDVIQYKNGNECFYRIFSADVTDESGDDDCYRMTFCGDVAWSAASTFEEPNRDDKAQISLTEACGKHRLNAELWTAEPGVGFCEHMEFADDGTMTFNECYDYAEEHDEESDEWKATEKPEDFWEFSIF